MNEHPTAAIVDDEALCREPLVELLRQRHPAIRIVGQATNVPEGVALVRSTKPDILFLDIEMGGMTGFDLLKAISPVQPQIIFTTAHEGYAVRAIRFNALDYLLKPIVATELDDAVNKAVRTIGTGKQNDLPALLGSVISDRQIALPISNGLVVIHLDDILYCTSDKNYTEVFVRGEKKPYVISKPLSDFDGFLRDQGFVRIHQSHLVNRKHIKRYIRGEGGELVMSDGANLPVSRRQKAELIEVLDRI